MKLSLHQKRRFKVFWRFLGERQKIWERRKAGKKFPWTKDPILRDNKFTNIYRELDRGTIYWFREVLPLSEQYAKMRAKAEPERHDEYFQKSIILATCVYRLVNRISTFAWIENKVGYPVPPNKKSIGEWYNAYLSAPAPRHTGAHIVAYGPGRTKDQGLGVALEQLEKGLGELHKDIQASDSLEGVWKCLQRITGIGGFISYEIVCDLVYAKAVKHSINSWCNPGPGCIQGVDILLKGSRSKRAFKTRNGYIDFLKWLRRSQHEVLRKVGIEGFPFWDGKGVEDVTLSSSRNSKHKLQLSLRSLEHSMCEFQKYWRCLREGGKAKNRYTPSNRRVT